MFAERIRAERARWDGEWSNQWRRSLYGYHVFEPIRVSLDWRDGFSFIALRLSLAGFSVSLARYGA